MEYSIHVRMEHSIRVRMEHSIRVRMEHYIRARSPFHANCFMSGNPIYGIKESLR